MENVFLEIVFAVLKEHGIDTTDMSNEEAIRQFEELANKDSEVATAVVKEVAEKADEGAKDEEVPTAPVAPTTSPIQN